MLSEHSEAIYFRLIYFSHRRHRIDIISFPESFHFLKFLESFPQTETDFKEKLFMVKQSNLFYYAYSLMRGYRKKMILLKIFRLPDFIQYFPNFSLQQNFSSLASANVAVVWTRACSGHHTSTDNPILSSFLSWFKYALEKIFIIIPQQAGANLLVEVLFNRRVYW